MLAAERLLLLLYLVSVCTLTVDNFYFMISGFAAISMQEHQQYLTYLYDKAERLWHAKITGCLY